MPGLFGDMFEESSPPANAAPVRQPPPAPRNHDFSKGPYTFPFGKHKGTVVADVPLDYLIWVWFKRDGEPLRDPLASCVRKALESYNIDPDGEAPEQSR